MPAHVCVVIEGGVLAVASTVASLSSSIAEPAGPESVLGELLGGAA